MNSDQQKSPVQTSAVAVATAPFASSSDHGQDICLRRGKLELLVSASDGTFALRYADEPVFSGAQFRIDRYGVRLWSQPPEAFSYEQGEHELRLRWTPSAGYAPQRHLTLRLHEDHLELAWAVHNPQPHPLRVRVVDLMFGARLEMGEALATAQHLVMGAGATPNPVVADWRLDTNNGAMLTWQAAEGRRCLVAGGLGYAAYARRVCIEAGLPVWRTRPEPSYEREDEPFVGLQCWDPHGVTIEPGATYVSADTSYVSVGADPFVELERYGQALAVSNAAKPNFYNFPTLCGWMASTARYGDGKKINFSHAMVAQCDLPQARQLAAYTPIAVRLEPDHYAYGTMGDTQQGWWDDDHWRDYGTLTDPYPSMASFCAAVVERNAIPFTYIQSSMPSNDFAAAHPEWMLHGDISLLHVEHSHQLPHVRYDYTAPGFQAHCLERWTALRTAGMRGVKFDYPETAWNPQGGFSDRAASTTMAYRAMFALCRDGLGPDAFIHERNLGGGEHETAPRLDVTAGIVDLQRVWGDASHFEPEMASRIGLRWYKSRRVFGYYPDGKSFYRDGEPLPVHERRAFLSLIAFLSGRLELGTAFNRLEPEMLRDLSRVFPMLPGTTSPRPVDFLLGKEHPECYAYQVDHDCTQVLIVNNDADGQRSLRVPLSGDPCTIGSIGLDPGAHYHVHEFWSQRYLGCLAGADSIKVDLRHGEVAMLVVRRQTDHPQVIATDRHLYQGWLDLHDEEWDPSTRTLRGTVDGVVGDPIRLTIACNGAAVPEDAEQIGPGVVRVTVPIPATGRTAFALQC